MERRGRLARCARRAALRLGLAGAALLAAHAAQASTVLSVSMDEMIERSELVFEGRVIGRRFVDDGDANHLRTCVRFEVLEVVKGAEVASPLELCFAGGRSKRGVERAIAGLEHPAPGEHGVYFVESLASPRISPLYGWDQGRFLVSRSGGMKTAAGKPVVALDATAPKGDGISHGVARGARVAEPGARSGAGAMDATAFKARVRELAAEGQ
jgi:hypothetical protein